MGHMPYHHCEDFRNDDGACTVCGDDPYNEDDTDTFPECYDCHRKINPYEEQVQVWTTQKDRVYVMLCNECHYKRKDGI